MAHDQECVTPTIAPKWGGSLADGGEVIDTIFYATIQLIILIDSTHSIDWTDSS